MQCKVCRKEIILIPSAKERAKKYGNTPRYYTELFTVHTECFLEERKKDDEKLIPKN